MEKNNKVKNNILTKQKTIIATGMLLVLIALIILLIISKSNSKKQVFIDKILDVYNVAYQQHNKDGKITFSDNGFNPLNLDNKELRYCVNYDGNGISLFQITDGKYSVSIKDAKDIKLKNVKKTSYDEFECDNPLPVLALSGYDPVKNVRNTVFNQSIDVSKIEKVSIVANTDVPKNAIQSYDASLNKDNSVIIWITDSDKNGKYEMYIGGKGGVRTSEDASYLFAGLYNTKTIDLTNLDTSSANNMKGMFYYLVELENINFGTFDTSMVTDMSYMFYYLIKIKKLNLKFSGFDTSNVTNMQNMFSGEWTITDLDLSNFNTSNVKNMKSMFSECGKLSTLNIKNFDFSNVEDLSEMFTKCYLLSKIDVEEFNINSKVELKAMFCDSSSTLYEDKIFSKFNDEEREKIYSCNNK